MIFLVSNILIKFKFIFYESPLHFAVLKGNPSIVSLLANSREVDLNMFSQSSI